MINITRVVTAILAGALVLNAFLMIQYLMVKKEALGIEEGIAATYMICNKPTSTDFSVPYTNYTANIK